jgi:hypothetical protein
MKGFKRDHYIDSKCSASNFNDFVRTMMMAFPYGCYVQLVSMITPYVDYIIPLSQLTRAMETILEPMLHKYEHTMPDFITTKNHNAGIQDFDVSLKPAIRDKFNNTHSSKFWFYDEVRKEWCNA